MTPEQIVAKVMEAVDSRAGDGRGYISAQGFAHGCAPLCGQCRLPIQRAVAQAVVSVADQYFIQIIALAATGAATEEQRQLVRDAHYAIAAFRALAAGQEVR